MANFSKRAQERLAALEAAPSPSTEKFYHKELNPDGPISLATAENGLMSTEMLSVGGKLAKCRYAGSLCETYLQ
jgi:hypothetical protein